MKLNFTVRRTVELSPEIVIDKITLYLKKNDYRLLEKTVDTVIFSHDVYRANVASKTDYYTKVNDGKFEVFSLNKRVTLSLVYRISILREFLFLTIIFAAGVTVDYKAMFLALPFLLNFFYKIFYLNTHVLNEVINS